MKDSEVPEAPAGAAARGIGQSREEAEAAVVAYKAKRWADYQSGKRKPRKIRRIDFDQGRGVFTVTVSRDGGAFLPAPVIAVSEDGRSAAIVQAPVRPRSSGTVAGLRRRSTPRPRERRGAARRGSTRAGPDDDSGGESEGEPEPPGVAGRLCAVCGCDISHRRAGALTCGTACRVRLSRAQAVPLEAKGARYWPLDPSLAELLSDREDPNDPLVTVLIECGDWPVAA